MYGDIPMLILSTAAWNVPNFLQLLSTSRDENPMHNQLQKVFRTLKCIPLGLILIYFKLT